MWPRTACATAMLAALTMLVGCGSGGGSQASGASVAGTGVPGGSCAATVVDTLARIVRRVYEEGTSGEKPLIARRQITGSARLRSALQGTDAAAVQRATAAVVAEGHITNLLVARGGRTLGAVGPPAIAPVRGVLLGRSGQPLANYVTSAWSDEGFLVEADAVSEGSVSLRSGETSLGGSLALPSGALPARGTLAIGGRSYQYASFAGHVFPSGPLRVYLLRTIESTRPLCGRDSEETLVRTVSRVARLIYRGEAGARTVPQVRRVQRDPALLAAVAHRDPAATRHAVEGLLNQHIVRLRVLTPGGRLLGDVGGPYVLAPVSAALRLHGRTIGRFVLSIQDDEGYLRLARRLADVRVLMYMNLAGRETLVKNSLGPEPGSPPPAGSYAYRGQRYRVLTLRVAAFPSGPLRIVALIPIPYS